MAYLLFECLSEEMPAKMQSYAEKHITEVVLPLLEKNSIKYEGLKVYTTPRRIAIIITNFPQGEKDKFVELRGPRLGASEAAITGFLKKTGKSNEDLNVKKTDKGDFYFIDYSVDSRPLSITVQEVLENMLIGFDWPKSMKWSSHKARWIRPIINLLCLFGGNILPVEFVGMKAGGYTYGHRFRSSKKLDIASIEDYFAKLSQNYVILDQEERFNLIKNSALEIAKQNKLKIEIDEGLLKEITGLVEYPTVLLGRIDEEFLALPKELLIMVMKNHQRYHCLLTEGNNLAPFFLVVSNNGTKENVIKGNEKVLRARLADAKFLVEQDLRNNLEYYADKLTNIIFHSKLGSIKKKVERVTSLAKYISVWVPSASLISVEETGRLIKADLSTEIVKEFPQLQGIMGSYYAESEGRNKEVVDAISDHYYPLSPDSPCTNNPVAITLVLADKVDTIVGFMIVGEKFSSSRDPFGLRRLATGFVRTIMENNLMIPLNLLVEKSVNLYPISLFKRKKILNLKNGNRDDKLYKNAVVENVVTFLSNRIKFIIKSKGISENIFDSILSVKKNYVVSEVCQEAKYLKGFLATSKGETLVATYKRISHILHDVERGRKVRKSYHRALFIDDLEIEIDAKITKIKAGLADEIKEHDIKSELELLESLAVSVNDFLEKVLINHENKDVRKNRLKILSYIRYLFNMIVNFDHLIGSGASI